MLAADRDIYFLDADTRLRVHNPSRIAPWIAQAKPIVATSIKDATKAISRQFKSVTEFFTRTHVRPLDDSSDPHTHNPLSTQNVPDPDPPD
jgi:hypothetical protein